MLIKDGILWVDSDDDYLVGSITIPNMELQDILIYEYNQWKSNDCTLYSALGCLWDLFNYKFTSEEIKEINDLSYKMGRVRGKGRWTFKWFKCVRNRWNNKYPDKTVKYFKMNIDSEDFLKAISFGYSIGCTYKWNSKYNNDFKDDGIVQWKKFWLSTYWHATRVKKRKHNEDHHIKVIDSYAWRKYNIYEIPNLLKLVDTGVFSSLAYMFIPDERIAKTGRQLKLEVKLEATKISNSELRQQLDKCKVNNEINMEAAEDLQRHLSETNNIIRSFVI